MIRQKARQDSATSHAHHIYTKHLQQDLPERPVRSALQAGTPGAAQARACLGHEGWGPEREVGSARCVRQASQLAHKLAGQGDRGLARTPRRALGRGAALGGGDP